MGPSDPSDFLEEIERQIVGPPDPLVDLKYEDPLSRAMSQLESQMVTPPDSSPLAGIPVMTSHEPIPIGPPSYLKLLEPVMPQEHHIPQHAPRPDPPPARYDYLGFVQMDLPRFGRLQTSRAGARLPQDDSETYCFREHEYVEREHCQGCELWDGSNEDCLYSEEAQDQEETE